MRILTVCTSWRVFGAEVMSLNLLEAFKGRGHEQQAVTSIWTDGDFSRRLSALGIGETKLPLGALSVSLSWRPMLWTAEMLARIPWVWLAWTKLLREFRPDVVVLTNPKQALLL